MSYYVTQLLGLAGEEEARGVEEVGVREPWVYMYLMHIYIYIYIYIYICIIYIHMYVYSVCVSLGRLSCGCMYVHGDM